MSCVLAHLVPESSVMALSPSRDDAHEPAGIILLALDAIETSIVW